MDQDAERVDNTTAPNPDELLAEGKRCLAAGDVASAVESFQTACSILVDQFGQLSKELAEPYYLYGKALLECAQLENTVLGPGMKIPEEEDSSDDENDENDVTNGKEVESEHREEVPSQLSVDSSSKVNDTREDKEEEEEDKDDDGERQEGEAVVEKEHDTDVGPSSGKEGDVVTGNGQERTDEEGAEEEEETDLKLAWEVLELARVLCQREDTDEYKLKLSDVYFSLGEVALESDQIDQAVVDMNSGLQLRELLLEPYDRRLAEGHFNLGLAYSLQKDHQSAIKEYKCAKKVLSHRKDKLVRDLEGKEGSDRKDIEEELADLESLLPELDSKIKDAEETSKSVEEVTTTFGFSESTSAADSSSSSKAPINDISHLMRKRPAVTTDDAESMGEKAPKRIRTEMLSISPVTQSNSATNATTHQQFSAEQ